MSGNRERASSKDDNVELTVGELTANKRTVLSGRVADLDEVTFQTPVFNSLAL